MSTGLIIALIVIAAVVVIIAAAMTLRARGPRRGPSLKRRFGPEYDRAVARHDGDAKAAERELTERVHRHGDLRERALEPAQRERYEARWTAAQERFVDSPREAVAEADRLLAELMRRPGLPGRRPVRGTARRAVRAPRPARRRIPARAPCGTSARGGRPRRRHRYGRHAGGHGGGPRPVRGTDTAYPPRRRSRTARGPTARGPTPPCRTERRPQGRDHPRRAHAVGDQPTSGEGELRQCPT